MSARNEINQRAILLEVWQGEVTRIEPTMGSDFGVPDVGLVGPQFPWGWAEFKYIEAESDLVEIRAAQRLWWLKNLRWMNRIALVTCLPKAFVVEPVKPYADAPFRPGGYPLSSALRYPYSCASLLPRLLEGAYALN